MTSGGTSSRARHLTGVAALVVCLTTASVVQAWPARADVGTPGSPSDRSRMVSGMGVPWAVGMQWGGDGSIAAEWPSFYVPSLRMWDTRTTWADVERVDDHFDFSRIDDFLTTAADHGTHDIVLVLGGTPEWAARRSLPGDAAWIGPGSASPPSDWAEWSQYVSDLASRYRGRIATYEIGNEPNLPMFWNGTPVEYGVFVSVAARVIAKADPSARIVANLGVVRRPGDVPDAALLARLLVASPHLDGLTVHVYPSTATLSTVPSLLRTLRQRIRAVAPRLPVWVTEANIVNGSSLSPEQQGDAVETFAEQIRRAGYARLYWYAWTRHGPQNLIQLWPGTPASSAVAS